MQQVFFSARKLTARPATKTQRSRKLLRVQAHGVPHMMRLCAAVGWNTRLVHVLCKSTRLRKA